ncbi:MAG: PadR family transcriptional regulator [Ruminococcus sp.]
MANKNNFINGITELLILSILNKHDSYVYEIVKSITEFSGGLLSISQNTIYTAAYKLESEGKITEYSKLVGKKRTRVYYHIESSGIEYLNGILENYKTTTYGVQNIFSALSEEEKGEINE